MNQAERDQHEIEIAANKLFPGWIRRVELLQHGDAPMIEPGQLMPKFVFAEPVGRREGHPDTREVKVRSSRPSAPGSASSGTSCCGGGPRSGISR